MIKVFVSDLDGTLFDEDHQLPSKSRSLITMLRQNGYRFGIATGRPRMSAETVIEDLEDLVDFAVFENGAEAYDFTNGTQIFQYPLDRVAALEVIANARKFNLNPTLTVNDKMYTDDGSRFEGYDSKIRNILVVGDVTLAVQDAQAKILVNGTPEVLQPLIDYTKAVGNPAYKAVKTGTDLLEFMDPRVNKTLGIQWYLENHGLTMENVVAFGDNDNDVEMIEAAQIGVAVKNATDSVKAVARMHCDSNIENGVYKFITQFLEQ